MKKVVLLRSESRIFELSNDRLQLNGVVLRKREGSHGESKERSLDEHTARIELLKIKSSKKWKSRIEDEVESTRQRRLGAYLIIVDQ